MTPWAKSQIIKSCAREVGFDLIGITSAVPLGREGYYRDWLAAGYAGAMGYLARNVPMRDDPAGLLPGARSVICLGVSCHQSTAPVRTPSTVTKSDFAGGRMALYARGGDYHAVLRGMLEKLAEQVRERAGEPFQSRACVDTAPLLERELACRAGLGWLGRNTCLLHAELGSNILLGELITTLELEADEPVAPRCGSCRRCVAACPTGALVAPGRLDARKCISYLTIEHRGTIDPELQPLMGAWIFGCDVCQQVCPYNKRAPAGTCERLVTDAVPEQLDLVELLRIGSGAYRRLVRGTALGRASRQMLRRNAAIALGNVPVHSRAVFDVLETVATDENEESAVRDAARRSLERLRAQS